MLLLPLGLNIRIFTFPWVTTILSVLTVAISVSQMHVLEEWQTLKLESPALLGSAQLRRQILSQNCENDEKIEKNVCDALKKMGGRDFFSVVEALSQIEQQMPKKNLDSDQAQILSERLFDSQYILKNLNIYKDSEKIQALQEKDQESSLQARAFFRAHHLLSKKNKGGLSLLKAQFMHGGWGHLVGNLAFFIFLSIFVELRLGGLVYGLLYLITGSLGMFANALSMDQDWIPLIGASANIAGVAGAFCVLFWRQNMKILVSYFFAINRVVYFPAFLFFPLLVFSSDVVGLLNAHSPVAHLAHLVGFSVGGLLAAAVLWMNPLPSPFLFFEEYLFFQKAKKSTGASRLNQLLESLRFNPENEAVHRALLAEIPEKADFAQLPPTLRVYIEDYLPHFLGRQKTLDAKLLQKFTDVGAKWGSHWPSAKIIKRFSFFEMTRILDYFMDLHSDQEACLIYEILLESYPGVARNEAFSNLYSHLKHIPKSWKPEVSFVRAA
jgi:membrane associated rhomboid family serine protease